jgi:molybdate transport system substrate-binding protein
MTKRVERHLRLAVIAVALLIAAGTANAADIKVLATTAMKAALDALAPQFAAASAHTPRIDYGPSGALAKRVADGEAGDLVILAGGIDDLIRQRRVVPASRTDIARARIGVAVRKGAAKPDISSPEAFRRALLAARSVAYAGPASGGASGVHLVRIFESLGIAADIAAKARYARGGPDGMVSALVAAGEAEIGLQQISEIMSVDGVELVGPLPDALQTVTVYAAGILTSAEQPDAAKALVAFLMRPASAAVLRDRGLEPASRQ